MSYYNILMSLRRLFSRPDPGLPWPAWWGCSFGTWGG